MEDWQQRVVDEKTALDDKIAKLQAFANGLQASAGGSTFGSLDQNAQALLMAQLSAMDAYSWILALRIATFQPPPAA